MFLTLHTIQHWDVANIGFLKNLYWDVDIKSFAEFFQIHLQRLSRTAHLPVGLKVKTPYDGTKRDPTLPKTNFRDRIQAIHISVQGQFKDVALKHMKSILLSTAFKRRYAIEVRLIPLFDRRDSPYTQDKIRRCIDSHGQFCRSVDTMTCSGIGHLDQVNSKLKKSIRELVVGLPDAHFLSIDLSWRGDEFCVLFPKKYDKIARGFIAHIGAYLHKAYGEDILSSLPVDTQEIIASTVWSDTGEPKSQLDVELDSILEADNKIEFIDLTALNEHNTPSRPAAPAISTTFVPQLDDQTISTFGASPGRAFVTPRKNGDDSPSIGAQSCVSGLTIDSRVSKVEAQLSTMVPLLKQICDQFSDGPAKPSNITLDSAESVQADSAAPV